MKVDLCQPETCTARCVQHSIGHRATHQPDPTHVRSIVLGLGLGWVVARLPFSDTPEELRMHVALCSGLGADILQLQPRPYCKASSTSDVGMPVGCTGCIVWTVISFSDSNTSHI